MGRFSLFCYFLVLLLRLGMLFANNIWQKEVDGTTRRLLCEIINMRRRKKGVGIMAKVLEKMTVYTDEADNSFKPIACPRYINDVYSIGTNLHYYIGDIYLQLAEGKQGDIKQQYKTMAIVELEIKDEIQKIGNASLNEILGYFYNNGGTVVESALSYQESKAIQPFFNRILDIFTKKVDLLTVLAANGRITPGRMESIINYDLVELYSKMSKLFPVDKMVRAFDQLVTINLSKGQGC